MYVYIVCPREIRVQATLSVNMAYFIHFFIAMGNIPFE
jgi:hypothetical protein